MARRATLAANAQKAPVKARNAYNSEGIWKVKSMGGTNIPPVRKPAKNPHAWAHSARYHKLPLTTRRTQGLRSNPLVSRVLVRDETPSRKAIYVKQLAKALC